MAATDKLQLICPRCHAPLTLDCGFAGSVCRCSRCGELLSVRGSVAQEDQLSRPDCPLGGTPKRPSTGANTRAAHVSPTRSRNALRHRWLWVLLAILVLLALATAAAAWWAFA